jgi:hypothetical protein
MTFVVEHGDNLFLIVDPDGDHSKAVHYGFWSSMEYRGRIYGAFLTGEVSEDDKATPLDGNGNPVKVYDITDFPKIVPVKTVLSEVEFDGEVNKAGVSRDGLREVECGTCGGDGFIFEKIVGWIAPPPDDDEEDDEEGDGEEAIDVEPIA